MRVDQYGRVILDSEELFSALFRGEEISGIFAEGEEIDLYNKLCRYNDKKDFMIENPPMSAGKTNEERRREWMIPEHYRDIDIWSILEEKCHSDEERLRLAQEKIEYESRDLTNLLRLMAYLVDSFRSRGIIWGVGRGSSVASLALYLVGITKINPLKYGLEINGFLKD